MKQKIYYLFLSALIFSGCSRKEGIRDTKVKVIYEPAIELTKVLEKAEKQDKVVFLDMYTDWCLPCKVMDEEVFSDEATAKFLNKYFINYKVNAEKLEGPDLSLIYSVDAFPTLLFLDAQGRVITKHVGSMGVQKFNIIAEEALAIHEDDYR